MDVVVLPTPRGGFVVWADDSKQPGTMPVRLAHFDHFDTAYLLLYAFTNAPGSRELLAQAPEVMASLDEHCGHARH